MSDQLSPEVEAVVSRIQKMLNLASKNPNKEEAALAAEKAQEMLAKYNLSMSQVEKSSGSDGRRERQKVYGGLYLYQRELWEAVAKLNFCMYFHYKKWEEVEVKRKGYDGKLVTVTEWKLKYAHSLVGRVVNVASTKAMASYLEQAIERITREHIGDPKEYFTRYGNSFREGMADEIISKIWDRRRKILAEEHAKKAEAERKAKESGIVGSSGTALTLATYIDAEHDANIDFIHGEGTSARWAAQRAERAAEQAKREAEYTAWAKANPEEAKRMEEEREAAAKKSARRHSSSGPTKKYDPGAYWRGRDAGKKVGIDQQTGSSEPVRKLK